MKVPEVERACGIEVYATNILGCKATIRSSPEDFTVIEVVESKLISRRRGENTYPLLFVVKKGLDAFSLERSLSRKLGCRIRFLGLKDKRSLSLQYAVAFCSKEKIGIDQRIVGYVRKDELDMLLIGNIFKIRLRHPCTRISDVVSHVCKAAEEKRIPNFFGVQRFGIRGTQNHVIGRLLVKRKFRDAAELLAMGRGFYEAAVRRCLEEGKGYLEAIRKVPIRIRKIFTEAYQSYLFNRTLSLALKEEIAIDKCVKGDYWCKTDRTGLRVISVHGPTEEPEESARLLLQLPGYTYRETGSRFDGIMKNVMEEEGIESKDFFVKEMQEVSCKGGLRRASLDPIKVNLSMESEDAKLSFILPRGQYATVFLREIIKTEKEIDMFG